MQMPFGSAPSANGGAPGAAIKDATDASFMQDVIAASREVPVIVDFWAPWCGPCKQLGPILEKVVRAANGAVRLVKVDIDKNPQIAGQLRIQSIPAVYAFKAGRPVDGFMGALPESQVRSFVERLVGGKVQSPIEEAIEEAKAALEAGEHAAAGEIFGQVLQHDQGNAVALAGLAQVYLVEGQVAEARELIAAIPEAARKDQFVAGAISALEIAEQAGDTGDLRELERRLAADPHDHQARFDLALALVRGRKHREAADALLEIVRRDRSWNEDAARKQLVKFFEAWGPKHELTGTVRKQLSSVMFS